MPHPSTESTLRASVCIPTRNRRDLLLRTLETLDRQTLPAARFDVVTIGGPDYRHRDHIDSPPPLTEAQVADLVGHGGGLLDHFVDVTRHLATVHPSRYRAMLDGVASVGWTHVRPVADQVVALRLVVLADRLYDAAIPVFASGHPLGELFAPDLLAGGYRKKYYRAISRLTALARPQL